MRIVSLVLEVLCCRSEVLSGHNKVIRIHLVASMYCIYGSPSSHFSESKLWSLEMFDWHCQL